MNPRRRLLKLPLAAMAASALPAVGARAATATDLPALVAASKPSVVAIGLHAPQQNPQFRFRGTGFAVGDGRKVATCAHVLPTFDPARRESIALAVPGEGGARIIRARAGPIDRDTDLAVLEFDGPALPPLELADASAIREGGDVLVLGFPIGGVLGLFAAAHRGIIAAVTPMIVPSAVAAGLSRQNLRVMQGEPLRLLQLDATTFPGNSGGPLVDVASGGVVGVISLGLTRGTREGAVQHPTGISYAVPVQHLAALLVDR